MEETASVFNPALLSDAVWSRLIGVRPEDFAKVSHPAQRKMMIAHMFENTSKFNKFGKYKSKSLNEDVTTDVIPNDNKVILPVIRKMLAAQIAFDLATVQPLTGPNGRAFIQSFKATRARGNVAVGQNFMTNFSRNYSSEYVQEEPVGTGDNTRTAFTFSLIHTPIRPYSASWEYSVTVSDGTETFTDNGAGVMTGSAGGAGTIDYSTGRVVVTFDAAPEADAAIVASYSQNMEGSSDVGELSPTFETVDLHAKERRLRFTLTQSMMEDMAAQVGTDAMADLTQMVAQFMTNEIDREIIQAQLNSAGDSVNVTYSSASADVELASIRALITRLSNASAEIYRRTKIAPANYIVCPPAFTALLDQLSTHANYRNIWTAENRGAFDPAEAMNQSIMGESGARISRVGTLGQKWTVYEDPELSANDATKQVLLGLRGKGYFQSGTIYAPYVPLTFSSAREDVETASVAKACRTRYALKVHRPEFYMAFNVSGLETF